MKTRSLADKRAFNAALLVGLCLSLAPPCLADAEVYVNVLDVVAPPGRSVRLKAKIERAGILPGSLKSGLGWHNDVIGGPVEFLVNGEPVGQTFTNDNGAARVTWLPPGPGEYHVAVRFAGTDCLKPASDAGLCAIRPAERPCIVLDIDQTVSTASWWDVVRLNLDASPLPGSPEVVRALQKKYDLIYVTARSSKFQRYTRRWLAHHGFPRIPTLFINLKKYPSWNEEIYKTATIARLKGALPGIFAGIGDKDSDAKAYLANDLRALILGGADVAGVEAVRDWPEVGRRLLGEEGTRGEE